MLVNAQWRNANGAFALCTCDSQKGCKWAARVHAGCEQAARFHLSHRRAGIAPAAATHPLLDPTQAPRTGTTYGEGGGCGDGTTGKDEVMGGGETGGGGENVGEGVGGTGGVQDDSLMTGEKKAYASQGGRRVIDSLANLDQESAARPLDVASRNVRGHW